MAETPLLIYSQGAVMKKSFKYIFGWRGLVFYTKHKGPLQIDSTVETIAAKSIWIPS